MIHGDDSISVDLGSRTYEIPIVSHQLAHCAKLFEKWWYIRDGMSSAFCTQPPPHGSVWVAEKRNAGSSRTQMWRVHMRRQCVIH